MGIVIGRFLRVGIYTINVADTYINPGHHNVRMRVYYYDSAGAGDIRIYYNIPGEEDVNTYHD
jgi:hypothetical protein